MYDSQPDYYENHNSPNNPLGNFFKYRWSFFVTRFTTFFHFISFLRSVILALMQYTDDMLIIPYIPQGACPYIRTPSSRRSAYYFSMVSCISPQPNIELPKYGFSISSLVLSHIAPLLFFAIGQKST